MYAAAESRYGDAPAAAGRRKSPGPSPGAWPITWRPADHGAVETPGRRDADTSMRQSRRSKHGSSKATAKYMVSALTSFVGGARVAG